MSKNRELTEEEKTLLRNLFNDVRPLLKSSRRNVNTVIHHKNKKKFSQPRRTSDYQENNSQNNLTNKLDLHGLTLDAAYRQIKSFLTAHLEQKNKATLLIITGKGKQGKGELQKEVPRWLTLSDLKNNIKSVTQAPPQKGGAGALCIKLRYFNPA